MKKMVILSIFSVFALCMLSNSLFSAETNVPLTAGSWIKYSGSGTITNMFDTELNKDVLKITPAQGSSIIAKYPASGSTNMPQIVMSMKIKTTKTFSLRVYVLCSDNKYRWVYYEPGKVSYTKTSSVVKVKVGEGLTNGQWQAIKSNVDADLFTMFGVHVNSIKQIRLYGDLSLGELRFQDPTGPLDFTIFSPGQNEIIANMYVRLGISISQGLSPNYAKVRINGLTYPISGGGSKYPLVPLNKGLNVLNIIIEDDKYYENTYKYGYGSFTVNCDPDSHDIAFLAPNNWSITSGQGAIDYYYDNNGSSYFSMGNATYVTNLELNVSSSNNSNLIIASPTLDISKEGFALKIKSSDYSYVYLLVKGINGLNYYIYYQMANGNPVVSGNRVYYKIGKRLLDNEWHTLVRDLDEDLFNGLGVHLDKVVKIYFYGKKFSFVDARLLKRLSVPEEYVTIQDAIDTAIGGGLVKVAAGIYQGGILMKSGIVLMGMGENTIIDGTDYVNDQFNSWGILNPDNNNFEINVQNQVLSRLVIQNCDTTGNSGGGSAVRCGFNSDSISIVDCQFKENNKESIYFGGRARVNVEFCSFSENSWRVIKSFAGTQTSYVNFIGCNFSNNTSYISNGGDICFFYGVRASFRDCVFTNNSPYNFVGNAGIIMGNYLDGHFKNCLFIGNISQQPVIALGASDWNWSPDIQNCTFHNNTGGAISISENQWGANDWVIKDNIIVNNGGSGISITYYNDGIPPVLGQNIVISSNDVMSNNTNYAGNVPDQTGSNGNISANPIFVTGPKGNYYLSQTASGQAVNSPCVNSGSGNAVDLGLDKYTTRTDGKTDTGVVDVGYHYNN